MSNESRELRVARLGCGECGRENPATGRTCYWCAAPVCAMCAVGSDSDLHVGHFCSACGRRKSSCLFGEGMRFCRQCGIRRPDDEGASAPLPLTKTGGHDNGCASDWALALTPDVLSKIFLSFGGIRDIVTCALVNRQWYAVARSKVVWRSLFVSRWGWASSRWWRDVKEATGWFRIYARRHQLLFENSRQESVGATTQMPAPIEDCHRSSCPGLWENLPPDTRRGQIVKTRRCFDCRATVVRCETADEAQLCVDDGCLDAEIASWFPGDSGYPAAFLLARDPVKTTDWMFSPWYFGRITRSAAIALLQPCPEAYFLVRKSLTRPNEYCISVKLDDNVEHIRIIKDWHGYKMGGSDAFDSMPLLVDYYMQNSLLTLFPGVNTPLAHWPPRGHSGPDLSEFPGIKYIDGRPYLNNKLLASKSESNEGGGSAADA